MISTQDSESTILVVFNQPNIADHSRSSITKLVFPEDQRESEKIISKHPGASDISNQGLNNETATCKDPEYASIYTSETKTSFLYQIYPSSPTTLSTINLLPPTTYDPLSTISPSPFSTISSEAQTPWDVKDPVGSDKYPSGVKDYLSGVTHPRHHSRYSHPPFHPQLHSSRSSH